MSLEKYCILGNRHISILPASISSAILQVVCICNLFIVNVNKYSLRLKGSKSSKTIHYQAVLTYLAHPYMGLSPPLRKLHVSRGKQTWIWTTKTRLFMNFLLLNVAFLIQIFLSSLLCWKLTPLVRSLCVPCAFP